MNPCGAGKKRRRLAGFTLPEVVLSISIAGISSAGILTGYLVSSYSAEWAGESLAAQSFAIQGIEQLKACNWNPQALPVIDETTNSYFSTGRTNILDYPIAGTNYVYATNFFTVVTTANPPLKLLRVDCVWKFRDGKLYTNTVAGYRGPDSF